MALFGLQSEQGFSLVSTIVMTKVPRVKGCQKEFCHYNSRMSKKMGRPPRASTGAMGKVFQMRLTDSERKDYQRAAERAELSLSEWIRDRLNKAAKRESKTD